MNGAILKDRDPSPDQVGSPPGWLALQNMLPKRFGGAGSQIKPSTKLSGSGQYHMLDVALFLERVYHLSGADENRAVDAVYQFLDDCLLEGDFSACDAALKSVHPEKIPSSVIISILIVTRRAKPRLPAREGFFTRTIAFLSPNPEKAEIVRALQKYR